MTSVATTCRDLTELLPAAQLACRLLFQECYKQVLRTSSLLKHTVAKQGKITFMHRGALDQGK
ncbi:hypothetical protein ACMGD3_05225 [Lysinibacillus sphaericus]|uniref:hypothetical protein n=1 Tax=Lysinibacillus sphaericus TaxID=1421 RepID=UPI003F798BC7